MSDNLESIVSELTGTMPEVSEHAISEALTQEGKKHASETTAPTEQPGPPVGDSLATAPSGEQYNPKTHKVSEKTGKIIKKGSGSSGSKSKISTSAQTPAPAQVDQTVSARATGKVAAALLINLGVGVFGDEFIPEKSDQVDERAYLENAFGEYFIATGRTDLPPGWALAIAVGTYTLPRFTRPKTRSKLAALRDWAVGKFFAWRSKKAMKEAVKNAQE